MTLADLAPWCGVNIRVLPDFLLDHTLLPEQLEGRMREVCVRWVQLLRRLWAWQGTTFCLRFLTGRAPGRIDLYLLARPARPADREAIQSDLEQSLAAFGIVPEAHDWDRCLPLLSPAALARAGLTPERAKAVEADVLKSFGPAFGPAPAGPFAAVTQQVSDDLWWVQQALAEVAAEITHEFREEARDVVAARLRAYLPHLWTGPEDAFLLPFRALIAATAPVCVSVYAQPTELTTFERRWLEAMRRKASAFAGHEDFRDLGTELAAGIARDAFTRLLPHPFLVAAEVASLDNRAEDVTALAATLRAVSMGGMKPGDNDHPEPGSRLVRADTADGRLAAARASHQAVEFPRWADDANRPKGLRRLDYLADARAAATLFRLPVSVNGGIAGVETRQRVPDFHPGPRVTAVPPGDIDLGRYEDGGYATMRLTDLTKHALITGFTGAGKTVTVLRLLHQLWDAHRVPFLVLESAKQEYRGLFGVPAFARALRVYTLGNETAVPFRLNPFELLPGVRVEAHVGRLQVCFEGAMPPVGPSSSVIAEALVKAYAACGWTITDACPEEAAPRRPFPTLSGFVEAVTRVIEERKYAPEVKSNVTAAIAGRLNPLLLGSKGRMFDCQRSAPAAPELFLQPTILEMNDLNADDKALVVMFLLTLLREYRDRAFRATPDAVGKLAHVTVVEEAHNVLAEVQSAGTGEGAGADTKFKAVEAFCALLTEVRALGEGLIIADQSPEKLAADAMRNTNLQIAHQLRDGHDRDAVANAMIMTDEQRDFIGKLRPGRAAVFRTGLERATFVTVPPYYPVDGLPPPERHADGSGFNRNMPDEAVIARMEELEPGVKAHRRPVRPHLGCDQCEVKATCPHGDAMWGEFHSGRSAKNDVTRLRKMLADKVVRGDDRWAVCARLCRDAGRRLAPPEAGAEAHRGVEWCYMVHLWHACYEREPAQALTPEKREVFALHLLRVDS